MAKAESVIFDTLSGKFGTVTSRTRRNGAVTLSANSNPSNPQSTAQTTHRDKYAAAVTDWLNLTDEQKAAYGDPSGSLPAYQNYMKTALGSAQLPTGGTITEVGGYRIHTFTENGTFENFGTISEIQILLISGGGGGGSLGYYSGGGGGGGLIYDPAKTISTQSYNVTIGNGGAKAPDKDTPGFNGTDSIFDTLTALGGGGGGARDTDYQAGNGGCGGGAARDPQGIPGTGSQGYNGGDGYGGGGGGTGEIGETGGVSAPYGGTGGDGLQNSISGTPTYYGGGGGGGSTDQTKSGGLGGGGSGAYMDGPPAGNGTNGLGGGGGGGSLNSNGGNGGKGIVIIAYPIS